ncbi:hypothetical protein O4158_21435 [Gordonia amicalis]|uniref:Uncharacterized protein n=1 Tax=Gordonia amicalis TaxID=89053 RepID=A0ABU4DFJ6_9ACTN|nr:hypothetical protein [Gordonia amicalis]MCZ4581605.1 hypothetical protein [Gordonia amicalis]MDV6308512.1 hypothetical protein [Gordonia amicalis]
MKPKPKKQMIGVIAATTAAILMTPAIANAAPTGDATGGSKGGYGGAGLQGTWKYFKSAPKTPNGGADNNATAWQAFYKSITADRLGWSDEEREKYAEGQALKKGANPGVCKESRVIAWVAPATGIRSDGTAVQNPNDLVGAFPHTNARGTFGEVVKANTMNNSLATATPLTGSSLMNNDDVKKYLQWDKKNNNKMFASPGYTLLCSWWKRDEEKVREYETINRDSNLLNTNTAGVVAGATSYTTIVSPQILETKAGIAYDPIGKPNLHTQSSAILKTNFGKLMDEVVSGARAAQLAAIQTCAAGLAAAAATGGTASPAAIPGCAAAGEFAAEAAGRIAADQAIPRATVELDALNKEGLKEGGVLNVQESAAFASFLDPTSAEGGTKLPVKEATITKCKIKEKFNNDTNTWEQISKTCHKEVSIEPGENVAGTDIPVINWESNFYQIMSVHCNEKAAELSSNDPTLKVVNKDSTEKGGLSTVLMTKQYGGGRPLHLDFGDKGNPDREKAATGEIGYYDKECPFECAPAGAPRATLVSVKTPNVEPNNFKFFRDNVWRTVNITRWVPKASADVNIATALVPVSTTINRWVAGTPGTQTKTGGRFEMKTITGAKLFTGDSDPKEQKNYSLDLFSNANTTILPGLADTFQVRSSWASDANAPQVINVKWEYAPLVISTEFSKVGFGGAGGSMTNSHNQTQYPVQGKCYANYGTTKQYDTTDDFYNFTGTGSDNNLDNGEVLEGSNFSSKSKPADSQTNLVITFLRATTN